MTCDQSPFIVVLGDSGVRRRLDLMTFVDSYKLYRMYEYKLQNK